MTVLPNLHLWAKAVGNLLNQGWLKPESSFHNISLLLEGHLGVTPWSEYYFKSSASQRRNHPDLILSDDLKATLNKLAGPHGLTYLKAIKARNLNAAQENHDGDKDQNHQETDQGKGNQMAG